MVSDVWVGFFYGVTCSAPMAFLAGRGVERFAKDMATFKRTLEQIRCEHHFMPLAIARDRTDEVCTKCCKVKKDKGKR